MKKVYVLLLAALVILSAFIVVQAQDNNQNTTEVTEAAVTVPAVTESTAEEKGTENVQEQGAEGVSNPVTVPDGDPEQEEIVDPTEDPTEEPKQEEIIDPTEEHTEEPKQEEIVDPTEEPTKEPDKVTDGSNSEEPTENSNPETTPEPIADVTENPEQKETTVPESGKDEIVENNPTATEAAVNPEATPAAENVETPEPTEEATEEPTAEPYIYDEVVVSIKGAQVMVTYDGQRHQANGYKVTGISNETYKESDFIFTGHAAAELTESGIAYMGLNEMMFVNKNTNFVNVYFDIEDGFIEVDPINVEIEIIGHSESVEYDGEVHSAFGYEFRQVRPESPQIVTAESFGLKDGAEAFVESDKAGLFAMGLNSSSFESYNPNFNRVLFNVTDGFVEIKATEEPIVEEILPEETETPVAETPVEGTPAATETPEVEVTEGTETPAEGTPVTTETPVAEVTEGTETPAEGTPVTTETPEAEATEGTETPAEGTPVTTETPEAEATEGTETPAEDTPEVTETPEAEATEGTETPAEGTPEVTETPEVEATEGTEEEVERTVNLEIGTALYTEPDETSEVIITLDEETEYTLVKTEQPGWFTVQLDEETIGYVFIPETVEPEEETEEAEEEVKDDSLLITSETIIREAADGMSNVIFTASEDVKVKFLGVEGEWVKIETADGLIGYIFINDVNIEEVLKNEETETEATEEPTETVSERKVHIFTSRRPIMSIGEEINLTSVLEGFAEDDIITYQWECDKGEGFEPVENGNGDSYSYPASIESLSWSWRLLVTVEQPELQ